MIHLLDMDLDHYGYFMDIHQDKNLTMKEFIADMKERFGDDLYEVIEISEYEYMFVISGNIRVYAWEASERQDLETNKFFRHITKRFDGNPMTKAEYREKYIDAEK